MAYLEHGEKAACFGCEACREVCPVKAITMQEDEEGFRYPLIDNQKCIGCKLCEKTCPYEHRPVRSSEEQYAFGGYHRDAQTRHDSTSGGAFSAIVEAFCDENYAVFGAEAQALRVFHSRIDDKKELQRLRKSKYAQSEMGDSYRQVKACLQEGKKVLFSGTPCQIAGLLAYLDAVHQVNRDRLLAVEVVCEGVPSPLYIRKMEKSLKERYGGSIDELDYRFTGRSLLGHGKWDFQQMKICMGQKTVVKDRWFNPFWSVWLKHYMSRPSCYQCPFAQQARMADITLGDLWGVHLYCPELYGKNGGASLAVANTAKGKEVLKAAERFMHGHELRMTDAVKYQSPMRKHIDTPAERAEFMRDLQSDMGYRHLNKKWAQRPTAKLLWSKYVWGNRQKVLLWNLRHKGVSKHD